MTPLDLAQSLDTAGKTCKMVKFLQMKKVAKLATRFENVAWSGDKECSTEGGFGEINLGLWPRIPPPYPA